MNQQVKDLDVKTLDELGVSDEVRDYVNSLLEKAKVVNEKTQKYNNCVLSVADDQYCNIRVDDMQLLYLGCALLPNMVNYLLNIVPQFLYPYVVAYLQDLSHMREDPFTINELFDIVRSIQFAE